MSYIMVNVAPFKFFKIIMKKMKKTNDIKCIFNFPYEK